MPTKAELEMQVEQLMAGEEGPSIILNDDEKQTTANHPEFAIDIWDETQTAIMLKHWRYIMQAQVGKALRGDTASAKFITDFMQDLVSTAHGKTDAESAHPAWEEKAIILRDNLGAEISAENLVETILDNIERLGPAMQRRLKALVL